MRAALALVLGAALILGGCDSGRSIFQGGPSLTASVQNPVGRTQLAEVEAGYGVALSAAVTYRRLGICRRSQVATLAAPCAQRSVVVTLQQADRNARVAILRARRFVRDYPTVSAVDVIAQARAVVDDFQNLATQVTQ